MNIQFIRSIEDWLGTNNINVKIIDGLVTGAIVDPSEHVRQLAITKLSELFSRRVKLNYGFVADNQVMVELQQGPHKEILYVRDFPRTYIPGQPVESHPFYSDNRWN